MKHTPLHTLQAFLDNNQPTVEEAIEAFTPLAVGDYDDIQIAALLTHIRTRGETFADVAGAAKAFLKVGYPFPITGAGVMDTAGTGGDGANTINITTGTSLVAAAGGVKRSNTAIDRSRPNPAQPMSSRHSISHSIWMPRELSANLQPRISRSYLPPPTTQRWLMCNRCARRWGFLPSSTLSALSLIHI